MTDEIENGEDGEAAGDEQVIAQAKEMCWVAKDEYRGDQKNWRDAG